MNQVKYRVYIKGLLKAMSPFVIGSYNDDHTDITPLKDNVGVPYIPGSSIGGMLKSHLISFLEPRFVNDKKIQDFFGSAERDDGSKQSMLITYDCFLKSNCIPLYAVRDGIRLEKDKKTTVNGGKFEYEVIEAGCLFDFKLEFLLRENDDDIHYKIMNTMIDMLKEGVCIGSKTSRGLGEFRLFDAMTYEVYGQDAYSKYVGFTWESDEFIPYDKSIVKVRGSFGKKRSVNILTFDVTFPDTLLIRSYGNENETADSAMLSSGGKPIIPGSSWSGLFRHAAVKILAELNYDDVDKLIEQVFGSAPNIEKKAKKTASNVVFYESVIGNGRKFVQTHTAIDRFTQGTTDGALYDDSIIADCTTQLRIKIRHFEKWIEDLLLLVVLDINDGYLAIGGQTSIGRGIFKLEGFNSSDFSALSRKILEIKETDESAVKTV